VIPEIDDSMAVAASVAISDAFGLGDTCKPLKAWLIDEGDRVLCAEYAGKINGTILLVVNEAVAERLSVDPQLLSGGFSVALAAIMESTGVELQLGEVVSSKIAADRIIEIIDNGRRGALFGITPLSELERAPFGGQLDHYTGLISLDPRLRVVVPRRLCTRSDTHELQNGVQLPWRSDGGAWISRSLTQRLGSDLLTESRRL
jgi:hypothetical protein